jgi:hypothetical protein
VNHVDLFAQVRGPQLGKLSVTLQRSIHNLGIAPGPYSRFDGGQLQSGYPKSISLDDVGRLEVASP